MSPNPGHRTLDFHRLSQRKQIHSEGSCTVDAELQPTSTNRPRRTTTKSSKRASTPLPTVSMYIPSFRGLCSFSQNKDSFCGGCEQGHLFRETPQEKQPGLQILPLQALGGAVGWVWGAEASRGALCLETLTSGLCSQSHCFGPPLTFEMTQTQY